MSPILEAMNRERRHEDDEYFELELLRRQRRAAQRVGRVASFVTMLVGWAALAGAFT